MKKEKSNKIDKRSRNYKEGYKNGVISCMNDSNVFFVNTDQYGWISKKAKGSSKGTLTLKKLHKLYKQAQKYENIQR